MWNYIDDISDLVKLKLCKLEFLALPELTFASILTDIF